MFPAAAPPAAKPPHWSATLPCEARDLNLTDPTTGYLNFVLCTGPQRGIVSSSLNAELDIEAPQTVTPHFQEWLSRLERCEPNEVHCTLVGPKRIPALFHLCVTEDKDSPSAISGSGCVCRRAFSDLEFGLPVVGEHFKHAGYRRRRPRRGENVGVRSGRGPGGPAP